MALVELVPAEERHIAPIAADMREADVEEARAFGHDPTTALWLGLKGSVDCMTALADGEPVAILGLTPRNVLEGEGSPWMLGTDEIYANPRATMVLSRKMLRVWSDSTPRLANLVAVTNDRAIRYLRRLGFTIGEERTVIGGVEFVTFSMETR